jgi:hypothetical protein
MQLALRTDIAPRTVQALMNQPSMKQLLEATRMMIGEMRDYR